MSSTVVKREPRKARLEEGVYDAVIKDVTAEDGVQTAFGVKDVIYVTFDIDGTELKKRYNKSFMPSSALFGLVSSLRPNETPMEFDVAELVGEKCRLLIEINTTDAGDEWENIIKVAKHKPKPTLEDDAQNREL
jgi:hypothetical protein